MKKVFVLTTICLCLCCFGLLSAVEAKNPLYEKVAVKPGDVIDKSNWQKAEGLVPEPVLGWIKNGWWIMKIGDQGYPRDKCNPKMFEAMRANKGKYAISPGGNLVEAGTGKVPEYVHGLPFPDIDPKDPDAGAKIMFNFTMYLYWHGNTSNIFDFCWVDTKGGFERQMIGLYDRLYYDNRHKGPIPNPDNCTKKDLILVTSPYDVKGIATLYYTRKGEETDGMWGYVPAIRRVRKMSPSNTSDAFVGSDFCNDDASLFKGKIQSMKWRLLRKEITLVSETGKPVEVKWSEKYKGYQWPMPDQAPNLKYGYEVPGWKGAPWAITDQQDTVWNPIEVWVVEGIPRDPYYNFGKIVCAVDVDTYFGVYKLSWDRAGEFWKTFYQGWKWGYVKGKEDAYNWATSSCQFVFDERSKHASVCHTGGFPGSPPYEILYDAEYITEEIFTMKHLLKVGK